MKAYWVESASAHIAFHDIPGSGPPLIFIHGLGCASSCDYPRIALDPALSGRRMVLVDLLGSGFSDKPAGFAYSIEAQARSLADLVTELFPGPVSIFGHSMGGSVAISLAALLGSRTHRLVLSEPNLDPGGGVFSRRIASLPEGDYVARGHAETIEAAKAEGYVIWAASMAASSAVAVHREAVSLVLGSDPTWRRELCRSAAPKTVIFGAHSLPDPDFEWLRLNGCAVDIVPAAGHSMALENPGGLARALNKALS